MATDSSDLQTGAPAIDPAVPARPAVGSGATLVLIANVAVAAAAWVTGVIVGRALGPDGSGVFNVAQTLLLTLLALANLGLAFGVGYYVSHGRWHPADALRQAQLAAFGLGVVGGLVGMGLAVLGHGTVFRRIDYETFGLALAGLPFGLAMTYTSYLALARDRHGIFLLGGATQAAGSVVLTAALAPTVGVNGAVASVAAANFAAMTAQFIALRRDLPPQPGWLRRTTRSLRRAFSFSLQSYFAAALYFLNLRIDLFIVNAYASKGSVGRYGVAVSITNVAMLLPRSLSTVVMPRVASLDAGAQEAERDMVTLKAVRHTVIIVVATGVALALVMAAIPLIYGPGFGGAVPLGLILIPGVVALGLSGSLASTVVGRGKPKYALYTSLAVTPPTVVLYFILIPMLGATGAALASTVSYIANLLLMLVFFERVTGVPIGRALLPGRAELADYGALIARFRARQR